MARYNNNNVQVTHSKKRIVADRIFEYVIPVIIMVAFVAAGFLITSIIPFIKDQTTGAYNVNAAVTFFCILEGIFIFIGIIVITSYRRFIFNVQRAMDRKLIENMNKPKPEKKNRRANKEVEIETEEIENEDQKSDDSSEDERDS